MNLFDIQTLVLISNLNSQRRCLSLWSLIIGHIHLIDIIEEYLSRPDVPLVVLRLDFVGHQVGFGPIVLGFES